MKLIFVYNADSGLLNALKDAVHKTIRPATYPCSLCALTYGAVSERSLWKKFRQRSKIDMEFLHIDEFEASYQQKFDYPVVLRQAETLDIALSNHQVNQFNSLESLIKAVENIG